MILRFEVLGPPVPKARARVFVKEGGGFGSANPAKTAQYEKHVGLCALAAVSKVRGWDTTRKSYALHIVIYRAPGRRGDADNFVKSVSDALEGIVYKNDRAVTEGSWKMIDDDPSPRINIEVRYED